MPAAQVSFIGSNGHTLAAQFHLPPGEARAFALFAHCFTCSKDLSAAVRIADSLEARGIGVLRFDFTGLGHSDGDFSTTNFSSNVGDLVAAAEWLEANHQAPSILVGHSLGGTAVLAAAHQLSSVAAIATIGAPADPAHVEGLLVHARDEIESKGIAEVSIGGRPFTIEKQFLDDIRDASILDQLATLDAALLICHSPVDSIVGVDNASKLFMAAKHPKSFLSLDKADHLLRRRQDATYVGDVIGTWASRFIAEPHAPEGRVVTTTGADYATDVRTGAHRLRADEPIAKGGNDTGPTPYDYLLAALGACTGMTLRMYADRKKWPLETVAVHLSHQKIHATDCDDCESGEGRVDIIQRVVEVSGDLSEAQRARLLEIANKCPVHRTLHGEIKVRSRLAESLDPHHS